MGQSSALLSAHTSLRLEQALASGAHAVLVVGNEIGNHNQVAQYIAQKMESATAHVLKSPSITDVRDLHLLIRTGAAKRRIIQIEDIDTVSIEAQNALLKMLEEPTQKTNFILTASAKSGVLPTIRSRATTIQLSQPSIEELTSHFVAFEAEAIRAARLASGGDYATMVSYLQNEAPESEIAKHIARATPYERLQRVSELAKDEQLTKGVLRALQGIYTYLMHASSGDKQLAMASRLEIVIECEHRLRQNGHAKLLLTQLFNRL